MRTSLKSFKKHWPWGAALALLAVGGVSALAWRTGPLRAEYPDSPFPPVAADYPRYSATRESPSESEREAHDNYWNERREVGRHVLHEGSMQDATDDEREAYRLGVQGSDYPAARDLAAKALAANPQSIAARFVFVSVEHEGEGNIARALFLVRKLRRQLHRRGVENPHDETARDWYLRVLEKEYSILYDLNWSEALLRVLDLLEQVYDEPSPFRRIWPLVKLHRLDAAEEACRQAEASGGWTHALLNQRLILADAGGNRAACYAAGLAAAAGDPDNQMVWSNHADDCRNDFRFSEAEAALLKSIRCKSGFGRFSPYIKLAGMLATRGRMVEAWDALGKAQQQRLSRADYTLVMDQYRFDRSVAGVFCLLGNNLHSLAFARRATEQPRRTGSTSEREEEIEFENRFLLWTQLQARQAQLAEIVRAGGQSAAPASEELAAMRSERWVVERQMLRLLADAKLLQGVMTPNAPGTDAVDPLFLPDLARILPPGVAAEALQQARAREEHPAAVPYFDAVDAELAWRAGRNAEAGVLAQQALGGLDRDYERPLRARVAVVAAEAARRRGEPEGVLALYDQALADCPVVFRLLDVAIPLKVVEDGSPIAIAAAERLLVSPRFRGDPDGFSLMLRAENQALAVELLRLNDVRHFAEHISTESDSEEAVAAAIRRIQARLMSPHLDLTATDIHSLDNGLFATSSRDATDRLLRNATPR